jgi:hypothetical protein
VRIDEDGYDAGESSKRKNYRKLKDVSYAALRCCDTTHIQFI